MKESKIKVCLLFCISNESCIICVHSLELSPQKYKGSIGWKILQCKLGNSFTPKYKRRLIENGQRTLIDNISKRKYN